MNQNRKRLILVIGWILFLAAVGLFCLQMGYLLVHERYQVEYFDNRFFYIINILFVVCIFLALFFLLKLRRIFLLLGISVAGIFIILQIVLLTSSHQVVKNYKS